MVPINRVEALRQARGEGLERATAVFVFCGATLDPDGEEAFVEEESDRGAYVGAVEDLAAVGNILSAFEREERSGGRRRTYTRFVAKGATLEVTKV